METIHAPTRRSLPPVPRAAAEQAESVPAQPVAAQPVPAIEEVQDPAQLFVERLRSAAADFAAAAGADTAVVTEAVPPARHRQSRCRLVLRSAEGSESDVVFVGPAGRPGAHAPVSFEMLIQRWLGAGQLREEAWLTADEDAPDGLAVDVSAWASAGPASAAG